MATKKQKTAKSPDSSPTSTIPGKHPGGRPPKYTPETIVPALERYFTKSDEEKRPYTVIGLCVELGVHRDYWCELGRKPEYSALVKDANDKIERQRVEDTLSGRANTVGSIFILKNHHGYKDVQSVEVTDIMDSASVAMGTVICEYVPESLRQAAVERLTALIDEARAKGGK